MQQIVSITSQGQVTIPKSIRQAFGIDGSVKAVIQKKGSQIIIEPKNDFWALKGVLRSAVKLTDAQLQTARSAFAKDWGRNE